jgi:hypothetical protein
MFGLAEYYSYLCPKIVKYASNIVLHDKGIH